MRMQGGGVKIKKEAGEAGLPRKQRRRGYQQGVELIRGGAQRRRQALNNEVVCVLVAQRGRHLNKGG